MKYKLNIHIFVVTVIIFLFITIGSFFVYDPMQLFHKPWVRNGEFYHENMRYQAAGIINNYEFDSVIFGTSVFQNISSRDAEKLFDGKFLNLSVAGADYYERSIILHYMLSRKKAEKMVIFSLDPFYFNPTKGNKSYPLNKFDFLYDENRLNDFKIYFNKLFFKCLVRFSNDEKCIGSVKSLEYATMATINNQELKSLYSGVTAWLSSDYGEGKRQIRMIFDRIKSNKAVIDKSVDNKEKDFEQAKHYLDETLFTLVEKFPNTKFVLVFPPYPRISYAWWVFNGDYNRHIEVLKYIVQQQNRFKNLFVYNFESEDFIDDLTNFRDLQHCSSNINSLTLKYIQESRGLIEPTSLSSFIENIELKAKNFDLRKFAEKYENIHH